MLAIALDLGTTSIKAAVMDQAGALHQMYSQSAPVITGSQGRYESDAIHYAQVAEHVLAQCNLPSKALPLGICYQRSSFLIWNKANGQPITSLISWQDNRGAAYGNKAAESTVYELTGLYVTPYYLAPKLHVLLEENPDWRQQLEEGHWLVGTLDTFLIWRWTRGRYYIIDASMAARTLLMDRHQLQWSAVLCELFNIPAFILPRICSSERLNIELDSGLVLQASVGDQSAALIASVLNDATKALVNLGTGGFVIRYQEAENNKMAGYLHTLVYQEHSGYVHHAIEGTLNSIAAALSSYPVDECRFEMLANSNIFCLAEPSGLGAPYFRDDWGIHFSCSIQHLTVVEIAVLLLEGIIFRVTRILEEFHRVNPLTSVYLSGGLSELAVLQQGIAQCAPIPVFYLLQKESSLKGAAMLASGVQVTNPIKQVEIVTSHQILNKKYQRWKIWLDQLLTN